LAAIPAGSTDGTASMPPCRTAGRGGHRPACHRPTIVEPLSAAQALQVEVILHDHHTLPPQHPPLPGPAANPACIPRVALTEVWPASGWAYVAGRCPRPAGLGRERRTAMGARSVCIGTIADMAPLLGSVTVAGCATGCRACIAPAGGPGSAATPGWRGGTPPSTARLWLSTARLGSIAVGRWGPPAWWWSLLTTADDRNGHGAGPGVRSAQRQPPRALC